MLKIKGHSLEAASFLLKRLVTQQTIVSKSFILFAGYEVLKNYLVSALKVNFDTPTAILAPS